MNHSGDAAEQIVRMSLEGVEVAAKISGSAAKEIATMLFAALKSKNSTLKPRGKARLTSMLKSGKALEIYSLKERDLQKFVQGAKEYGIVYCALRNSKNNPDGLCDIMVKADDAPKISRLSERFKFATVDKAKIESEIVAAKAEKSVAEKADGTETDTPDINDTGKLADELLGTDKGKSASEPTQSGKEAADNHPLSVGGMPPKSNPSEPTSMSRSSFAKDAFSRPSVKEEIREIKAARRAKEADAPARDDKTAADKAKNAPATTTHKQPNNRKSKSKKSKERT